MPRSSLGPLDEMRTGASAIPIFMSASAMASLSGKTTSFAMTILLMLPKPAGRTP